MHEQILALVGCVSGAARIDTIESLLREAGFEDVCVVARPESRAFIREWMPESGIEDHVTSATIEARRPGGEKGSRTDPRQDNASCGPECCPPGASA